VIINTHELVKIHSSRIVFGGAVLPNETLGKSKVGSCTCVVLSLVGISVDSAM
jgi:hypothetical protein